MAGVSGATQDWRVLIAAVRRTYSGRLTYAALPFEYQKVGFWDALDFIGVDAWWPLSTGATADVATLRRAWIPIVAELGSAASEWHKSIVFTEAGYTSQHGTAAAPSSWNLSTVAAPAEQAAGYRALLDTFSAQPWFGGVHWWAWRATNQGDGLDFTPQDKPAESVLRTEWAH